MAKAEDRQHGVGHPQVKIQVYGREAEVDEELAPLITEMWYSRIDTIMSCQQHDTPEFEKSGLPTSWVWLNLPPEDASTFCNFAAGEFDADPESLYQRISGDKASKRNWWYDGQAWNLADEGQPAEIMFDISIRFPREDLPEVLKRMEAINEVEWVDAQEMHKAHPTSFEVPDEDELAAIAKGMFIKVGAISFHGHERFWLEVDEVKGDTIVGVVSNPLTEVPLDVGELVEVERRHVHAIMTKEEQEAEEELARAAARGERFGTRTWKSRKAAEGDCKLINAKKPP